MLADLPPSAPQGVKLCEIFNHAWFAIEGTADDANNANWKTIGTSPNSPHGKFPLRQRSLWALWQDPNSLIGVRFDSRSAYALLDLDVGSPYLNPEGLAAITEALETIGIVRTIAIRSSWSGGVHIYIPLAEAVPTFDLAAAIRYTLEAQEIFVSAGQLEIFPNCKTFGRSWLGEFTQYNAHRLPLQPNSGSTMLDHNYQPIHATLDRFFWAWEHAASSQDMPALKEALKYGRDQHRKRPKLRAHPVTAWRADLELEIMEGWTGPGQTNTLLKAIACHGRVFEGLAGAELAEYVERVAVTRPGYLEHCQHRLEISSRARAWARAAEKYYWPMGSEPKRSAPTCDINAERAESARSRIKQAVIQLATAGELPEGVRERVAKICALARSSAETLYKYLHLWHPDQWSVTAHTAGNTADSPPPSPTPPDPLKSPPNGLLRTPPRSMKCTPLEKTLKKAFYPGKGGCRGGAGSFPQADG